MIGNCLQKHRLYKLWVGAVRNESAEMMRQYKMAHDNHVRACPLCQERINAGHGTKSEYIDICGWQKCRVVYVNQNGEVIIEEFSRDQIFEMEAIHDRQ